MHRMPQAEISWEGNSLDVLRGFPDAVRQNLGFQLRLLQRGEQPTDYRAMTSVGAGVFELRDEDEKGWYRVIYLSRTDNVIYVLHCFRKTTRKTANRDLRVAEQRLKLVHQRVREMRQNAKQKQK